MDIQQQIEQDLKAALLAGDKQKLEVLRGLKTALQYEAVSQNTTDRSVTDEVAQKVLAKEAKKRADTAEIYDKANETERSAAERAEKVIIDAYLPAQADESQIAKAVDEELAKLSDPTPADMGKIIGAVRAQLGATADGATIAKLVKEALAK